MQCEYPTPKGPCKNKAIVGSRFCERHEPKSEEIRLEQYILSKRVLGDSPTRHAAADEVKSLRSEIALLRSIVEHRINMLETDAEFVSALPTLKDSFLAIEKLVSSCHAMEVKLGTLLNKGALIDLAQKIVQVIDVNLQAPGKDEIMEKIGTEIMNVIAKQENANG